MNPGFASNIFKRKKRKNKSISLGSRYSIGVYYGVKILLKMNGN
jgi:hypothetical protein